MRHSRWRLQWVAGHCYYQLSLSLSLFYVYCLSFSAIFYGQRLVTAAWSTPSPWSIHETMEQIWVGIVNDPFYTFFILLNIFLTSCPPKPCKSQHPGVMSSICSWKAWHWYKYKTQVQSRSLGPKCFTKFGLPTTIHHPHTHKLLGHFRGMRLVLVCNLVLTPILGTC